MRDPANDPNLAAYASSLLMATWGDWQAVHMRAEDADGRDPRLVPTWLDLLDEHAGPQTGTVVRGAWGILLRDLLELDARNECYQPFARAVDASVFGLEEIRDARPS